MATNSNRNTTTGSQNVVAIMARSLVERKQDPEKVDTETGNDTFSINTFTGTGSKPSKSVIEGNQLNVTARENYIDGLYKQARDALQEKSKPRPRQQIPTSDLVRSGGFKAGKKLVIRIYPSASAGNQNDNKANEIAQDMPELIWDRFSLQSVAEDDQERYQIHETFEGEVLYLFGRRPRIWTFQGIVLNGERATVAPEDVDQVIAARGIPNSSQNRSRVQLELTGKRNMDFANELLRRYDEFYRGSRAVEQRAVTYIAYDDTLVEGTLLGMVAARNSQIPSAVNVTFTLIVHDRVFFGQQPLKDSKTGQLIQDKNIADLIAKQELLFDGEKVTPSQILAEPLNGAGLRSANRRAAEDLKNKQNEVSALKEQQDAARAALDEANKETEAAATLDNEADQALASAEKALASAEALPPGPDRDKAIQDAKKIERDAKQLKKVADKRLDDSVSKKLAAEKDLKEVDEAIGTSVSEENDIRQKADTIAANADAEGSKTVVYDPVIESEKNKLLSQGTSVKCVNAIMDVYEPYISGVRSQVTGLGHSVDVVGDDIDVSVINVECGEELVVFTIAVVNYSIDPYIDISDTELNLKKSL